MSDLAGVIDHTLLKPDATRADIERLCDEAKRHRFASACVNPSWVALCAERLRGSGVNVCSVVGFPSGAHTAEVNAFEAKRAIADGASEIDMVIDLGALKSGDDANVERGIREVVRTVPPGTIVKVILETALLSREEKIRGARLAKAAGAAFVKTSTGFAGGATVDDVRLLRETVGPEMGVKASGGIKTCEQAEAMIAAGATRIGTSSGVSIIQAAAPSRAGRS